MIRFIIESVARDGNAALNICLRPDGSIEDECVAMLEEVGEWMNINGEAIYGSRAWHTLGEGDKDSNGHLRKLPGGGLGKHHAEYQFSPRDFRFTVGKDGALYAFCMTVPQSGTTLRIHSLAAGSNENIKSVRLLGHEGELEFTVDDDALAIRCPDLDSFRSALVFRIDR